MKNDFDDICMGEHTIIVCYIGIPEDNLFYLMLQEDLDDIIAAKRLVYDSNLYWKGLIYLVIVGQTVIEFIISQETGDSVLIAFLPETQVSTFSKS